MEIDLGQYTPLRTNLKRRFGTIGSLTITEREQQNNMGTSEHTRMRHRRGRKPKRNVKNLYKLTRSIAEPVVLRWHNLNLYMTPNNGAIKLWNHKDLTTTTGQLRSPLHLYDITSFVNNVGGTPTYASPGYEIRFGQLTGQPIPTRLTENYSTTGAAAGGFWQLEKGSHLSNAIGNVPHRTGILDWFEYRMLCYGRSSLPTRYRVSVVQLNEDYLAPEQYFLDSNTNDTSTANKLSAFYNTLVAPFAGNPLDSGVIGGTTGMMKVLYKDDFLIASQSTVDGTATDIGRVKEIRGFHRLNRIQNYDWNKPDNNNTYTFTSVTDNNINDFPVDTPPFSPYVHPRARIYLMVTAQSGYTSAVGAPTYDPKVHPSYDLMLRVKHRVDD